ncbi:MAG TPA: lectin-like protein, partial [Planctomycetota bacterium]|nr:lectin-like protein [Planctomycetota bacterium]
MERRPLGSGSFAAVGTAGVDATSFSDGSVSHDTSYEYRVFATNGIGDSAPSNTASVTTPPPAPPNAPENLVATPVDPMRIDLSWSDSSSDETSFRIERRLRHDPLPSGAEAKLNTVNGHYYAFIASNIAPGDAHIQARKLQFFGTPGHMATITSAQENEFIREMSPTPIAWVGGTDRQSTPDWIFVSGPEAGQPMTYFNWAPGEPNNPGVEVYIAMYSDGTWNNVGDAPDWAGGYFVEFDTPPLPGVEFATVASVP